MPGPYVTAAEVQVQTLARLRQANSADLPEHWVNLCDRARYRGYHRLIGILAKRGYSLAQIDTWAGRVYYNLDYAVAYAFGYGSFARSDDQNNSEQKELARLDKELSDTALTDAAGDLIVPELTTGLMSYGTGRLTSFDEDSADFDAWGAGFTDDDNTPYEATSTT